MNTPNPLTRYATASRDILIFGDPFPFQCQFLVMVLLSKLCGFCYNAARGQVFVYTGVTVKQSGNWPGVAHRVPDV